MGQCHPARWAALYLISTCRILERLNRRDRTSFSLKVGGGADEMLVKAAFSAAIDRTFLIAVAGLGTHILDHLPAQEACTLVGHDRNTCNKSREEEKTRTPLR